MKRLHKIYPLLLTFLLLLPIFLFAAEYRVLRVVDGDTIVVDYQGEPEKVRLLCVNTPESVHPDEKQNIPMGKVASDYANNRLSGRSVGLEFEGNLRGKYGRLLAYVFVDGQNFNLELVRNGLSPYYIKYGLSQKYDQEFREAERYARDHQLNIWGDAELVKKYMRLKSKWGQKTSGRAEPVIASDKKDLVYHGNIKSKKFHRPSCRYYNCSNCIAVFSSREEAIKAGYVPCKVCKP